MSSLFLHKQTVSSHEPETLSSYMSVMTSLTSSDVQSGDVIVKTEGVNNEHWKTWYRLIGTDKQLYTDTVYVYSCTDLSAAAVLSTLDRQTPVGLSLPSKNPSC